MEHYKSSLKTRYTFVYDYVEASNSHELGTDYEIYENLYKKGIADLNEHYPEVGGALPNEVETPKESNSQVGTVTFFV